MAAEHDGYPVEAVNELEQLTRDRELPRPNVTKAERDQQQLRVRQLVGMLASVRDPVKGDVVAGAELIEVVGKGNFGAVWHAHDASTGDPRAVKVFDAHRMALSLSLYHFRRGVRAMEHLNSIDGRPSSVVRLFEVSRDRLAFSMPFLDGGDLSDVRRRGFSLASKLELFRGVCGAVAFAQAHQIIHRDVKPANIVMHRGEPVLTDFDIAELLFAKTRSVNAAGSWFYSAPEQIEERPTDATVDIFSLGRLLHYLLLERDPPVRLEPSPSLPDLAQQPEGLVRIIRKCTQYDPAKRYQSAGDLLADLARWEQAPKSIGEGPASGGATGLEDKRDAALAKWREAETHMGAARWDSAVPAGTAALELIKGLDYELEGEWTRTLDDWKSRTGDLSAAQRAGMRRMTKHVPLGVVLGAVLVLPAVGALVAATDVGKLWVKRVWADPPKPDAASSASGEPPPASSRSVAPPVEPVPSASERPPSEMPTRDDPAARLLRINGRQFRLDVEYAFSDPPVKEPAELRTLAKRLLPAAERCIHPDSSWQPSHDVDIEVNTFVTTDGKLENEYASHTSALNLDSACWGKAAHPVTWPKAAEPYRLMVRWKFRIVELEKLSQ